jgi:hypothetical protein
MILLVGGVLTGSLWMVQRAAREALRLEIVDRGRGIPGENRHAVFDPFFAAKKGGQSTGLGLPVAAAIVRNHGGALDLVSAGPNQGATAIVSWPAAEPRKTATRRARLTATAPWRRRHRRPAHDAATPRPAGTYGWYGACERE